MENTTSNVPAVQTAILPSAQEFQMFQTIAKNAQESGLYSGVGHQSKIFMILLAARELGVSPMLALNGGIWNIQGKIEISARLMNSLIRRAGHSMQIKSTSTECTITGKRVDTGETHVETFTWAMAEKAGLSKGNVWQKYPEDMLYNRCMSRLARRLFADVIGTSYVEGEVRDQLAEKELPTVAYEEIKKPIPALENMKKSEENTYEIVQEAKISEVQFNILKDLFVNIDEKCKENMLKYLNMNNDNEFRELNENQYSSCIKGMMNNIRMNAEKEQNENPPV